MKNYDREKLIEELKVILSKCAMHRKFAQEGISKLKKIYEINKDPKIKEEIEEAESILKLTDGTPEMEDFCANKEILKGN